MVAPTTSTHPRILAVVRRIPRGRVATYGQIAALAGLVRHARSPAVSHDHTGHGRLSSDLRAGGFGFRAHRLDSGGVLLGRPVRRIQAKYVDAVCDELREDARRVGGGTKGGDDLGVGHVS